MAEPIEELKAERLKKINDLRGKGINPFPARLQVVRHEIKTVIADGIGKTVNVAGRIRAKRAFGKLIFLVLEDESGRVQLIFKEDGYTEDFKLVESLDVGDFISVGGQTALSKTEEFSVMAEKLQLLTKSTRPLPSEYYGLNDVEERSRKRYLDLLMNGESKKVFEQRSKIVYFIRKFLIEERGYTEVECPVLQPLHGGTRARPFKTHHNSLDMELSLRISNELYLKRLIVGGFEKVFEIGHTFRNEGMDRNHNPEFTMLETMHAYADYLYNMDLIEEMFEFVVQNTFGTTEIEYQGTTLSFKRPWARVSLTELFEKHTGVKFHEIETMDSAFELAKKMNVSVQDFMSPSEMLLEIFEKVCITELVQPTLVYDYPADFYPLAKRKVENSKLVESFDIYVAGMEMGTNWSEQNDPEALRVAWLAEKEKLEAGNEEAQLLDEDFLEAMEYGMPPTSGIGPGIDRWVMILTNQTHLRDVILFPTMKASGR